MSEKEVLLEEDVLPVDVKHAYIRQMETVSNTIVVNSKVVLVLSVACMFILIMVVCISKTLLLEKKIVLTTIIGVILVAINLVLCISKKMPSTVIIFSTVSAFISGLCLGFSMQYL